MIDLILLSLGLTALAALLLYYFFFRRPVLSRERYRGSQLSLVIVGPSPLPPVEQRARRGLSPFLLLLIIAILVLLGLNLLRLISFIPSLIPLVGTVWNIQTLSIAALAVFLIVYLAWRYLRRAPSWDWNGETVIINEDVEVRRVPANVIPINASPSDDVSEIIRVFKLRVLEPRNPFQRTFLLYLSPQSEWWTLGFELTRYLRETGFKTVCLFFVALKAPQYGFIPYLQDLLSTGSPVITVDVEHAFPASRVQVEFIRQRMVNLLNALAQLLVSTGQRALSAHQPSMKPEELIDLFESKILVPCLPVSEAFSASGRNMEEALQEAHALGWCDVDPAGVEKIFICTFSNRMDLHNPTEPQQRIAVSRGIRDRFQVSEIRICRLNVENPSYPFLAFLVCNIEALLKMERLERVGMRLAIRSPIAPQAQAHASR